MNQEIRLDQFVRFIRKTNAYMSTSQGQHNNDFDA